MFSADSKRAFIKHASALITGIIGGLLVFMGPTVSAADPTKSLAPSSSTNSYIFPIVITIIILVMGIVIIGVILFLGMRLIRRRRSKTIVPGKIPWQGTTSNVQHEKDPLEERYVFVLLGTTLKPDGSEARFEKSVEIRRRAAISSPSSISGAVFNGRQVTVYGQEDESGWIRATKIVDKETGAVTE